MKLNWLNIVFFSSILLTGTTFTACSDENSIFGEDKEPGTATGTPVDETLVGNYKGFISYGNNAETPALTNGAAPKKIAITKTSDTTLGIEISGATINGSAKDIKLKDITISKTGTNTYTFKGAESVYLTSTGATRADESAGVSVPSPVNVEGTIVNGNISMKVNVFDLSDISSILSQPYKTINYAGSHLNGTESTESKITAFSFDTGNEANSIVTIQPTIDEEKKTISFAVSTDATNEQLKALVPSIEISDKASIAPASGEPTDFTQDVHYTVVAEDGSYSIYTASISSSTTFYNFDNWVAGVEGQAPEMTFYEPKGWCSSNAGAHLLKAMSYTNSYVVTEDKTDAHSAGSAVKIQTIDSKGGDMFIAKIPKVTTGTLFLGKFETNLTNTLKSTKFGNSYPYTDKYPVQLKGYYKYEAGKDFYTCVAPYLSNCHKATIDNSQKDKGNITVVLYEVPATDKETDTKNCLTGAEGEDNIKTSSRIAAIGTMDVEDQATWKEFTLDIQFKNGKSFNPSKKYRLAINCSSSYLGDRFWGAPGSTLWVDDFELIYKNIK